MLADNNVCQKPEQEPRAEADGNAVYGQVMHNGKVLPAIGLGCWMRVIHRAIQGDADEAEVGRAVRTAVRLGYRFLDTATLYGNEAVVGAALADLFAQGVVRREDLFVSTKLSFIHHRPADAQRAFDRSLAALRLDYLDLYLMHTPLPFKPNPDRTKALTDDNNQFIVDPVPLIDTWRVLEQLYLQGRTRSIGVSNFNQAQLQQLIDQCTIVPHNLQVELHIYLAQQDLLRFCRRHRIAVTGYSTLGSPGRAHNPIGSFVHGSCLHERTVQRIAARHRRTEAQVLLRHALQRGLSVIPKSSNAARLAANLNVADFRLSDADFAALEALDQGKRFFPFDL